MFRYRINIFIIMSVQARFIGSLYISIRASLSVADMHIFPVGTIVLVVDWHPETETVYFIRNDIIQNMDAWTFHTTFQKYEDRTIG
jgi:hypothetical protein